MSLGGMHRKTRWWFGAVATLLSAPLLAAGFSVSPTRVEFIPGERVKGLRLHNTGGRPIQAQLRVYAWTQVDGADVLEPSTDLVVSPPMAAIAPGAQQLVRIVRKGGGGDPRSAERSYRLLVDELPPARVQSADVPSGLNFVVRYSVPVFVASTGDQGEPPELLWFTQIGSDGRLQIGTRNDSGHRAQLSAVRLLDAEGRILHRHEGLLGYVLANTTRLWPLDLPSQTLAAATAIEARINGETRRQPLSSIVAERGAR
jgi:fimbrial chaperone protein